MPRIFVVSAPSGTGKTTLNTRLMQEFPTVEISVSHTTRGIRNGENNGKSYHFVDRAAFDAMIQHNEMIEWAEVFGNLYGTSKNEIIRIFAKGHHVLLEIDVQGTQTIIKQYPEAVTVFILPPSIEELWRRLENRGTDKLEDRWRRLMTSKHEIEVGHHYEHFIVNNDREKAYRELKRVLIDNLHSSISHEEGVTMCQRLLNEFDTSPLLNDLRRRFEPIG